MSKLLTAVAAPYAKRSQLNNSACQQYATAHGYSLMPGILPAGSIAIDGSSSAVMNAGYGSATNVFGGAINGSTFLTCTWIIPGMGSYSDVTDYFQMGAIKLAHTIPSVIIRPKVGPLSRDYMMFNSLKNATKVQLEGDFNNYFEVFSSSSSPANAFEFLPPNVMAKLIDTYSSACIELAGSYLYFFLPMNETVSSLIQPAFDPNTQDTFMAKLVDLKNSYENMNQTNNQVGSSEVITHDSGPIKIKL